jgi:hypothetical protein
MKKLLVFEKGQWIVRINYRDGSHYADVPVSTYGKVSAKGTMKVFEMVDARDGHSYTKFFFDRFDANDNAKKYNTPLNKRVKIVPRTVVLRMLKIDNSAKKWILLVPTVGRYGQEKADTVYA